ncbi:MAG: hypothetical protein O3C57_01520 [Verrucomicrobia bacterium]|nr:hypothetical protein [Verrucomicrobiota bacterium]
MDQSIKEISGKDTRYASDSYYFVLEALEFTLKILDKPSKTGRERHISGRELLEGIRNFGLQEYGPMSLRVLKHWGIMRTEDFGEIVFNLVESGKLRRTAEDSREDFANGYDFEEAFAAPFTPKPPTPPAPKKSTSRGA